MQSEVSIFVTITDRPKALRQNSGNTDIIVSLELKAVKHKTPKTFIRPKLQCRVPGIGAANILPPKWQSSINLQTNSRARLTQITPIAVRSSKSIFLGDSPYVKSVNVKHTGSPKATTS